MSASSQSAITTQGLYKRFQDVIAVDGINLSVPTGQIFGLLGPNAAGKSTTIRLLTGIIMPDAGSVNILGLDLFNQTKQIKRHIGYVAQYFALYPELTVAENLSFYSGLYQQDNIDKQALLEAYGLGPFTKRYSGTLSGGYKRRLSIACAIAHNPDLIFLDEPTAGIDPVTRKELWDLFYELAAQGKTLFITTHYMEEAERCNQLAFIHHGKLVAHDTPLGIKRSLVNTKVYACNIRFNPQLSKALGALDGVKVLNQFGDELRIVVDKDISVNRLNDTIDNCLQQHHELHDSPVNIEDVFITLTKPVDE